MIPDWVSQFWQPQWLAALGFFTLISLLAAALLAPWLATLIPQDYFHQKRAPGLTKYRDKSLFGWLRLLARNLLGLMVMVVGIVMLFTPGQGILMLFLASMLLDYPGKVRFQHWLVRRKGVLKGINWLRNKAGAASLQL